jgi:hypothetical protein
MIKISPKENTEFACSSFLFNYGPRVNTFFIFCILRIDFFF